MLEILLNLKMIFPQNIILNNPCFSPEEVVEFQVNLEEMMHKRIKGDTTYKFTEFVSPTFIIIKPAGRIQLILNLKEMNKFVKYERFKIDGIKAIISMVTSNCFMATLDIKVAYYSVSISTLFKKFLKFKWKDVLWCLTSFLHGFGSSLRKFTKLNKLTITNLHFENQPLNGYIDGFFTKGDTFSKEAKQCVCMTNWDLSQI